MSLGLFLEETPCGLILVNNHHSISDHKVGGSTVFFFNKKSWVTLAIIKRVDEVGCFLR